MRLSSNSSLKVEGFELNATLYRYPTFSKACNQRLLMERTHCLISTKKLRGNLKQGEQFSTVDRTISSRNTSSILIACRVDNLEKW